VEEQVYTAIGVFSTDLSGAQQSLPSGTPLARRSGRAPLREQFPFKSHVWLHHSGHEKT
jgi:hypothetical protein